MSTGQERDTGGNMQPEHHTAPIEWQQIQREYPGHVCLHQHFEIQAAERPESLALTFEDVQLTFGELNERASQLAHVLQQLGVGPEVLVGVYMDSSLEVVISLLAILKAGGAYIALDPTYPAERIASMLKVARAPILLTREHLRDSFPPYAGTILCLTEQGCVVSVQGEPYCMKTGKQNSVPVHSANLAYVIFTSGSTGEPKGIQVSHASLLNLIFWNQEICRPGAADRMSQMANLSFDASGWEIWPTLTAGACLHLPPPPVRRSLSALRRWLVEQAITLVFLPTPLAEAFLELPWPQESAIRLFTIGGDKLRHIPAQSLPCILMDCYGPAETTIVSITGDVPTGLQENAIPSINRPVANTSIYLLAPSLQPVEPGEVGELYIGGSGLARGYLQRPGLTAERFLPCPFSTEPGARFYRTGDLARYLPDGSIEIIGRVDHQVKLRGMRIELGEIESVLCEHSAVKQAVVVAYEEADEKHLVAYLVPGSQPPPATEQLRVFLQARLPEYMLPTMFISLEALPLSANGKIDRDALPPPRWDERPYPQYRSPKTPTEIMLAQVWAEVLPVKQIGRDDDFFLLGGHSLIAMQMLSRLYSQLQREIPLEALFAAPTLAELARYLDQSAHDTGYEWSLATQPLQARKREILPTGESIAPLSFAQQALWLHNLLEPGTPGYTILVALHLHGHLNIPALERSFHLLLQRHEILRTTFALRHNQPVQIIAAVPQLSLPIIDISEEVSEVERLSQMEAAYTFDMAQGPLLRTTLLRLGDVDHVLLINMHHSISDGWSMNVLLEELGHFYEATLRDGPGEAAMPVLPLQYADYCIWQRAWMHEQERQMARETAFKRHLEYWKQQLAGSPTFLELPADYPRPKVQTYRGASTSRLLGQELTHALRHLGQRVEAKRDPGLVRGRYTFFMTLLAIFYLLLSRLTGEEDIAVGTPFANRNRKELEGLIGFFVNTLVLRLDLSGDPPFSELHWRVQQMCLEAYAHQDIPFDRLLEELRLERNLSHTPLFQIFFNLLNMLNAPAQLLQWPELRGEVHWPQQIHAKFDLELYVREQDDDIQLEALYNADLFTAARIQEMLATLQLLCEQVVAHPEQRLSHFSLITPASRVSLPDPTAALSRNWQGSVADIFATQAQRAPDRLAIRDEYGDWSYQELDERSNQVAHYLRAHSIHAQEVVAIYAHRSAALVCAILGVLKAGAIYVILDPAYPVSRLISYYQLAHARGCIQPEAAGPLPAALSEAIVANTIHCQLLLPPSPSLSANAVLQAYPHTALNQVIDPGEIAAISFTSGSTGSPRGVLQGHGSLTHFLPWQQQTFDLAREDRYSMLSGLSHDPLQRDIFTPLCLGATLCIPPPEQLHTPGWLATWMLREGITITNLTPALLRLLTLSLAQSNCTLPSLRYAFIVGDILTRSDVASLQKFAPALTCINLYGSTETQRALGYYICPRYEHGTSEAVPIELSTVGSKEKIPLGRGMQDTQLLVLNHMHALAGIGELGEICIRSPHLASGYLDDAKLTQERFIVNPFTQQSDDRLYLTGDLGRYLPGGAVEYVGRKDRQVKLRGFRIEPGEIEAALLLHPAIQEAVVSIREDTPGEKRLVAYLVPASAPHDPGIQLPELSQFLAARLPQYMLPSAFVFLEALPLLPAHKINWQALPPPLPGSELAEEHAAREPRNPKEEILLGLWQKVLKREQVGIYENFFELGGHSLLAAQLLSSILEAFQVALPLRTLFEAPTVASFATVLERYSKSNRLHQRQAQIPLARRSIRREATEQRYTTRG